MRSSLDQADQTALVEALLANGPEAVMAAKQLVFDVARQAHRSDS